jgi:hypothetical protein
LWSALVPYPPGHASGEREASGDDHPSEPGEPRQAVWHAGHDDAEAQEDDAASVHSGSLLLRCYMRCLVDLMGGPQFPHVLLNHLAQLRVAFPGFPPGSFDLVINPHYQLM